MSSRKPRITPDASADIRGILQYSFRNWGADARHRYQIAIYSTIKRLVDFPESGVARDDIAPSIRSIRVESHVILHEIDPDVVIVHRVLHYRMLPRLHEEKDDP